MKTTHRSLLVRMTNPQEHVAWEEFYKVYSDAIIRYAYKLGLDEYRAQDVLQETMTTLMRILPDFRYDPKKGKFRNFLLTIVHQKSLRTIRQLSRRKEVSADEEDPSGRSLIESLPARPEETVGEVDEKRWRQCLLEQCLQQLSRDPKIQKSTFDIFFAYVVANKPCAEIAQTFGVQENAVYQIKNRLTARLEDMMKNLVEEYDES
ncbi:MAG: sigma-70 family RNA polymerase sigma factor [Verrucomicrobiota bacterium]